jgi:lipid A 3-O-deacylase
MRSRIAKTATLVAAFLVAGAGVGGAQTTPSTDEEKSAPRTSATEDEQRSIYTIQIENDVFNLIGRSDRDYTSGVRLGWLSPALTDMSPGLIAMTTIPTFLGERPSDSVVRRFALSFGQNIYTPQDTWTTQPIFNDRPYAAWLYASFALQYTYKRHDPRTGKDEPVRLDTLQLDLGVVGPAAGGEFVQNNFHTLIGVAKSYGWANQLHNEPTVGLTFERRWRTGRSVLIDEPKLEVDFIPRIGAAVGNVATYASIGGTGRIGKNLRDDFGPTRARPALPGSEAFIGDGTFGWYLFAGIDGSAVARNIFLDGNTDGQSLSVWHRPLVGEVQAGLAILYRGVRLSYTQVLRTPEFFERERWTLFGSLNLTFRY